MTLLSFPNELLIHIAKDLDELKDLNSFLKCNRRLYALLNDTLYRLALKPVGTRTALSWAVHRGYERLVRSLLSNGVDPEAIPKENCGMFHERPLLTACRKGHLSIVRLLLEHGANINGQKEQAIDSTVLHFSVSTQYITEEARGDLVRLLLDNGADTNAQDVYGNTPLHRATIGDGWSVESEVAVRILCEYGANIGARNFRGRTPLHTAVITAARVPKPEKERTIINLLLEKGADLRIKDTYGRTPLHIAASFNLADVAEIFLRCGADINTRDDRGYHGKNSV